MRIKVLGVTLALICASGCGVSKNPETTPNLRGFGRVQVEEKSYDKERIYALHFTSESPEKAETLAGKFLMDLYSESGIVFSNGIHEMKGGTSFAVLRDGYKTSIYAADSRKNLSSFVSSFSSKLVEKAACPQYMKAYRWGTYGVGGLENFHNWMDKAKEHINIDTKKDKTMLDPREDYAFLREMGNMHFDNWLQPESFDNSDGILAPFIYSRKKLAEDFNLPVGVRLYMPAGGTGSYTWYTRRFAGRADKPAKWMQNGWLRYFMHMSHQSWYDKDAWGYNAAQTQKAMQFLKTGNERTWMHPAGELVHQPWYDWHADYSKMAEKSWHDYLSNHMTLEEASKAYNYPAHKFTKWEDVPVPEFATFAGLSGLVLDLWGDWQTSTNMTDWASLPCFPGNWDFLGLYTEKGKRPAPHLSDGRRPEQKLIFRNFRRTFEWKNLDASKRVYLYFFPMSGATLRHEVSLNGGKKYKTGNWCAIDVTDELKEGANTLDIRLQGSIWNGRVFLSTEVPEVYPNMAEVRCRLWTLWHAWRRDTKADRAEEVFDAMRQVDPNTPIEFMAPLYFGQRITNRLMRDWGAFAQFTGEGVWFFPWYKRYAKLYGYQGTSELAGPSKNLASMKTSTLRVFLAGIDMHKPVFLTQTYSRDSEIRAWWLSHKDMFARMGTYDIDLSHPQVLLYRRTELTGDGFPEPYPVIDEKVKTIRTPWNYDIGRGELQSIGQSFLYIDDDGIEDGKMNGFKVMIDCGNEIISEEHVNCIKSWVEKGGVFVAYPFTGRSTPLKAESWPIVQLTGSRINTNEKVVRPGIVPKVVFPKGSSFFPSFAGQTIHGAKRRQYATDFVLEKVLDDTEEILHWEDGRIAATARRVGKGMVVHLGSMFWRGSEDVKGMWNPQDEVERKFLRDLIASSGHGPAMVETDDRLVLAQPYRTHNGLGLVGVFCNFNETNALNNVEAKGNPDMEVAISMRTGTKPRSLVSYGGDGIKDVPFEFADGVVKAKIFLPMQEVKAVVADCYPLKDALSHWWKNSAEQWHEIKKLDIDFSKYEKGEWKDPTMDLKEGWSLADESKAGFGNIPLDCIQFWGWPEKKGGKFVKTFDLDDASWMANGGTTRLVAGAWVGRNFLTPSTIRLNGEVLVKNTNSSYLDFDVSKKIKEKGNVLEVELSDGEKFTGMLGNIYLYYREKPAMSVDALAKDGTVRIVKGEAGEDALLLSVPLEWKGKYRVRLYMEGKRNIPKGVRVGDRFMRKHHHNFGNITDIDITGLLSFGEENRIDIGANSPAEMPDKTSLAPVEILRFDLYPAK